MRLLLTIATTFLLLALSTTVLGEARSYVVIVNPSNNIAGVDRDFLADAFLKKITAWQSGDVIHPVDLPGNSRVRRDFSEDVLHRSISEVKGYWQQRIFSGRDVPPPELDDDAAVVAYVLKNNGAVGYVSVGTPLNGARVVSVR
jgi:ABC-type phosphate transport system substrate-binding protein